MSAFLGAIALLGALLWFTRAPRKTGGLMPHTTAQRRFHWDRLADHEWGTDTEERLGLQARGGVAKRRLLQAMRNIAARSEFQKRVRELQAHSRSVEIIERHGLNMPVTRSVTVTPLQSITQAQQPVIVRRPSSKLAKYG